MFLLEVRGSFASASLDHTIYSDERLTHCHHHHTESLRTCVENMCPFLYTGVKLQTLADLAFLPAMVALRYTNAVQKRAIRLDCWIRAEYQEGVFLWVLYE